jgi:hypothetical protein
MLNPSTADQIKNDPTVERCQRRTKAMGYGGMVILNLYAIRSTSPAAIRTCAAPIGPATDNHIRAYVSVHKNVICAWGAHAKMDRAEHVLKILGECNANLFHLGLTLGGYPRHPLYAAYSTEPIPWTP